MAGYILPTTGNVSVNNGRPSMPVVDVRLVRPKIIARPIADPLKRRPGEKITQVLISWMRAERATGRSLHEIGKECGVSHATVRRHTIDVVPPIGGWKTGARESKFPLAKMQRMRRAGFTYAEIAEDVGSCAGSMWNLLNERTDASRRGGRGRPSRLLQLIARASGVHQKIIRLPPVGESRRAGSDIGRARHIAFWIMVRRQGLSLPKAGAALRGFNHTSVLYGVRRVDAVVKAIGIDPTLPIEKLVTSLWAADWPARTA